MRQNKRMNGNMIVYGTRSSRAHSGMRGRFRTSSIALPMYMLVMIPQKTSGACLTRSGPGGSPWIISGPQENRHDRVGRNAQGEQRDERAAGRRLDKGDARGVLTNVR